MCLIFNFPAIFRSTPRQVSTALSRAKKLKKNKSNDKNGWAKYYTYQPQSRFPSSCLTRESPYTMFVNGSHRSLFYFFAAAFRTRIFSSRSFFFWCSHHHRVRVGRVVRAHWHGSPRMGKKNICAHSTFLFCFAHNHLREGGRLKISQEEGKVFCFFFAFTHPSNFEGCVMKLVALLNGVDRVVGQPVDFVQLMMIHFLNLLEANDFSVLSNTAKWKIDFVSVCHFVSPEHVMSHLVRITD